MMFTQSISRFRWLGASLLVAAVPNFALFLGPSHVRADEKDAIAILTGSTSSADKALACKRLAIEGTAQAVPALAPLLADPQLSSWARIALEAIPDPAASSALRDALSQVQGRQLIGVVNSIGVRADEEAVAGLAKLLHGTDAEAAAVAAVSLGKIGSEGATNELRTSLAIENAAVRSAVAEGCVLCAERLMAAGKAEAAAELYDAVRQADVSKPRKQEATRGVILARGDAAIPLLQELLRSPDKATFALGLTIARETKSEAVTKLLASEMNTQSSDLHQVKLVLALEGRQDQAALPAIMSVAQHGSASVRIAAMNLLEQVGDLNCVPTLVKAAAEPSSATSDANVSLAAKDALANMPAQGINDQIVRQLTGAKGPERAVLVEIAGRRRIAAATPELLKAATDADETLRRAAHVALGETVSAAELPFLVQRALGSGKESDAELTGARAALHAASIRMADREATATLLANALQGKAVAPAAKLSFVETLGAVGGKKALASVAAAVRDADPAVQDAASRVLGEWMTADAGPALLALAKSAPEAKHQVRALRGYLRIARQFVLPDAERATMCREALRAAKRDAEKGLVMEILNRYPSIETLRVAVESAKDSTLRESAVSTAIGIAQKVGVTDEVRGMLKELGQEPVKIEIVKAEYGAATQTKDVTDALRPHVHDFVLVQLPSNYNASLGGDPAPGVVKTLKVQYKINDVPGEATFAENATIVLPMPKRGS